MKRPRLWSILLALLLLPGAVALAQGDEEDYYLDEEIDEYDQERYALGLGFGLIELGDNLVQDPTNPAGRVVIDDDVEQYYALNFRVRFGDRHAHRSARGGFRGYLEPELGYWSADSARASISDLLLGVNIIGGMPVGAVEFFLGAGLGIHFIDSDATLLTARIDESDEALGFNAQFGVDVFVNRKVSVFGVGRFDIVDDDRDELEGKAYLGLRFHFGGRR